MENKPTNKLSRLFLTKITFLSIIATLLITIIFILPAEFGIDPTGLGKKLGILNFSSTELKVEINKASLTKRYPEFTPQSEFDYFEPENLDEPYTKSQKKPLQSKSLLIKLEEFEQVEVKAIMDQGDSIVYSWELIKGENIYSDFHADPYEVKNFPESFYIRYKESESKKSMGSLIAPFKGNHGWHWLNIEEKPVEIRLEVHGYFESLDEIMRSFQ